MIFFSIFHDIEVWFFIFIVLDLVVVFLITVVLTWFNLSISDDLDIILIFKVLIIAVFVAWFNVCIVDYIFSLIIILYLVLLSLFVRILQHFCWVTWQGFCECLQLGYKIIACHQCIEVSGVPNVVNPCFVIFEAPLHKYLKLYVLGRVFKDFWKVSNFKNVLKLYAIVD